ncbi:glycosyltransferase-like domain-containing protein 1 isoform X5 [Hemiscyllium ocellatum]|uniref:glycosyltransferase-like domain-containing protein 1 isoform X5 n=1 Tax=Hemiscyllium ocellatum TaxID=170820 RepID=UPI0029674B71|nr:glycosyltransferase-like domain-containing protein 1 isoform X5 [Hemiscyllium ocellatum]
MITMSVLMIEAFYGGSHKQLLDLFQEEIKGCSVFTLPAKKWHWRARTAALYFMQTIPPSENYRVLFTSSVLNLAELVALRPDLAKLKKVLYFHENQLVYPVRKSQERDFQFGYNQVISCLVADVIVFNSAFNMESFLTSLGSFMKLIPDHRPRELEKLIRPKCQVLYFPIIFPDITRFLPAHKLGRDLLMTDIQDIEDGKADDGLMRNSFACLNPVPTAKQDTRNQEGLSNISDSLEDLNSIRRTEGTSAYHGEDMEHVAINPCSMLGGSGNLEENFSAQHMPLHIVWPHRWLEAVHCGCYPLCPKALVYPEIFPDVYLYSTPQQLFKRLQTFCKRPYLARRNAIKVDLARFSWVVLRGKFRSLLAAEAGEDL